MGFWNDLGKRLEPYIADALVPGSGNWIMQQRIADALKELKEKETRGLEESGEKKEKEG